ncbi:MAG: DUF6514 family protein [Oscillospiraceae bacterium]
MVRAILMGENTVLDGRVAYYLLVSTAADETERYGVRIDWGESETASVPDVTASAAEIAALLDALVRGSVTPVTLRDVVLDAIS